MSELATTIQPFTNTKVLDSTTETMWSALAVLLLTTVHHVYGAYYLQHAVALPRRHREHGNCGDSLRITERVAKTDRSYGTQDRLLDLRRSDTRDPRYHDRNIR